MSLTLMMVVTLIAVTNLSDCSPDYSSLNEYYDSDGIKRGGQDEYNQQIDDESISRIVHNILLGNSYDSGKPQLDTIIEELLRGKNGQGTDGRALLSEGDIYSLIELTGNEIRRRGFGDEGSLSPKQIDYIARKFQDRHSTGNSHSLSKNDIHSVIKLIENRLKNRNIIGRPGSLTENDIYDIIEYVQEHQNHGDDIADKPGSPSDDDIRNIINWIENQRKHRHADGNTGSTTDVISDIIEYLQRHKNSHSTDGKLPQVSNLEKHHIMNLISKIVKSAASDGDGRSLSPEELRFFHEFVHKLRNDRKYGRVNNYDIADFINLLYKIIRNDDGTGRIPSWLSGSDIDFLIKFLRRNRGITNDEPGSMTDGSINEFLDILRSIRRDIYYDKPDDDTYHDGKTYPDDTDYLGDEPFTDYDKEHLIEMIQNVIRRIPTGTDGVNSDTIDVREGLLGGVLGLLGNVLPLGNTDVGLDSDNEDDKEIRAIATNILQQAILEAVVVSLNPDIANDWTAILSTAAGAHNINSLLNDQQAQQQIELY